MICPRCDGQGEIFRAQVSGLNIILYICDECDASWEDKENISKKTFVDLSTYLESKGTNYTDSPLIDDTYDWE